MEAFQTEQLSRLRGLISELLASNPFYRSKLRQAGITKPPESLEDFFAKYPFSTKLEFVEDQDMEPPYGTNLTYPLENYTRFHQTSGSTGKPMRWLDTPETWDWMKGNWQTVLEEAGVVPGQVILFAFSFGPFLGFWTAFEAAADMGCRCLPGGGLSTLARLRLIAENKARVLCCTPTYALRLGELALEEEGKLDVSSIQTIIVAGEPGGGIPETRKKILSYWPNAELFDHHGMTEAGPVSYTTAGNPDLLRIIETGYIAEILAPGTNTPKPPGEPGELVLTTLGRNGSPLIRYRTGDLVCGETTASPAWAPYRLVGGILGRIDDMITVRGVNIYPGAIERIIRRIHDISEFRVIVETVRNMTEMRIQIEADPRCVSPDRLPSILEAELKSSLALRITVDLVPGDSLPRFGMKSARWINRS